MSSERVVIIDDEEAMAKLLKLELESEGFKVLLTRDGKTGLAIVKDIHPNLVILDVMIPEIDGYSVLQTLKNDPSTKDIPVIIVTAKGLEADVQKGLDLGADDYILKPFHAALLHKRIKMVLKKVDEVRKKILIVEDEPDMRKMLALELEQSGYQVFQASDGEKGFMLAAQVKPDLIIADIMMPNIDGNQLMKNLRESDFGRKIPFIVLTARKQMRDYFEVAGVDDFITKPFEADQLMERIENVLHRSESNVPIRQKEKIMVATPTNFPYEKRKKRVLILENDRSALPLLRTIFEDYGYLTKIITNVAEFLEQVIAFHPDIVISKYSLDGMNAQKLIQLLDDMPRMKNIPILIYSPAILGKEQETVLQAGATDFLIDASGIKLLKKTNELLDKHIRKV